MCVVGRASRGERWWTDAFLLCGEGKGNVSAGACIYMSLTSIRSYARVARGGCFCCLTPGLEA